MRLKGGDPYIFGRGGEEAEALAAAKIQFEVVPGVSSVVAAPNYAGIPLTHRDYCSSFTVFTGHENPADEKASLRYEQIAKIPGTKIVLMGTENLGEWTNRSSRMAWRRKRRWPSSNGARSENKNPWRARWPRSRKLAAEKKLLPPALDGCRHCGEIAREIELG